MRQVTSDVIKWVNQKHNKYFVLYEKEVQLKKISDNIKEDKIMETNDAPIGIFPKDIVLGIMTNLDAKDLCNISRVSKSYRKIASSDSLWETLYLNTFGEKEAEKSGSWKNLFHFRAMKKFVRMIMCSDWNYYDIDYLIVELFLSPNLQFMEAVKYPDWIEEEDEVIKFYQKNPGYLD